MAADAADREEVGLALHLYRTGLSKAPRNAKGRLGLARLYLALDQVEQAKDTLLDGQSMLLAPGDHQEAVLQFLLAHGFDAELQTACDLLLSRPVPVGARRLAAQYAATLAFHRGNVMRAEALLAAHRLDQALPGKILLARMELDRGRPELARLRLDLLSSDESVPDEIFGLLDEAHRRLGAHPARVRNACRRIANDPLSPAPRIALLRLHAEADDKAAGDRETAEFIRHFGSDRGALLRLAEFAASTGRADLARQLAALFRRNQWPAATVDLLAAEALIESGRHLEALEAIDASEDGNAASPVALAPARDSLRVIALFALKRTDEARLQLEQLLARPGLRADSLHRTATRLVPLGEHAPAHRLLARAVALDPRHQPALTELVRLELALGRHDTLPALVRRLLSMRRPSRELLDAVARAWGSDRFLFHPEQAGLLRGIRRAQEDSVRPAPAPPQGS